MPQELRAVFTIADDGSVTLKNLSTRAKTVKKDIEQVHIAFAWPSLAREDERLEMFERLTWYKDVLEQDFPEGLVWDVCFVRESGEEVARIYARQTGADFHRRSDWGTLFAFMARQMYLLERNFMGIAEYLRE